MNIKPKTKLKALGCRKEKDIDLHILNKKSIKLFSNPHPQNIRKNNGGQFYTQFIEDLNLKPKEAKWQEGMYLILILIEPITTDQFDIEQIQNAFHSFYLNANIAVLEEKLTLIQNENQYFLQNKKYDLIFPIQSFNNADKQKINLSSKNIIHAQRELLKKYFKQTQLHSNNTISLQNTFSSISFIDHPIVLENVPDNIITGRAQGYQGAVISMKGCVKREILTTALHECLHILSISHCIWWDCIMNFSYEFSNNSTEGGSFHLCPSCLSKVKYQLCFDIIERYNRLNDFCLKYGYHDDATFVQKILKTF